MVADFQQNASNKWYTFYMQLIVRIGITQNIPSSGGLGMKSIAI